MILPAGTSLLPLRGCLSPRLRVTPQGLGPKQNLTGRGSSFPKCDDAFPVAESRPPPQIPTMTTATLPTPDTMYRALARRDASYEGVFWVGVRTTGIFCRPGCTARTPLRKNVEFFPRVTEALTSESAPGTKPTRVASGCSLMAAA